MVLNFYAGNLNLSYIRAHTSSFTGQIGCGLRAEYRSTTCGELACLMHAHTACSCARWPIRMEDHWNPVSLPQKWTQMTMQRSQHAQTDVKCALTGEKRAADWFHFKMRVICGTSFMLWYDVVVSFYLSLILLNITGTFYNYLVASHRNLRLI